MALFKKLAVFGAVATAYVRANDDAELDDMDNDDMPAMPEGMPGMPGMPEGMDMEKLQEMIANMGAGAGGEGGMPEGMDPEKMQEMMAGMKAPPAAKAVAVYNSTEDLTSALKGRKPSEALFVFEGAEDSAAHEAAKKVLADPKAFASVALLKTDGEAKLTLYKGGEETVTFDGDFADAEKVGAWAVENRVPAFGQIDQDNFEIYVESAKKGLFWACFDPAHTKEQVEKYSPAIVEAAVAGASGEDKFPFVWLDVAEFGEHAKEELGCKTFPTFVLQRGDLMSENPEEAPVEKFIRSFEKNPEDLTTEAVHKFFADITSGDLKAEAIPDPLDAMDDDEDDEEEAAAGEKDEEDEEL